VIRRRCCWIATCCLPKLEGRIGVQIRWHTKIRAMDREECNCWKPTMRGQCLPSLQLKFGILKCQHVFPQ
jgi:hypothetical protein